MDIWFRCPHCGKGSVDEQGETLLDYEDGLYKCKNCGGIMSSIDDSITYEEYKNIPITEDYVSFETAKLLKEKGFDEPVLYYQRYGKEPRYPIEGILSKNSDLGDGYSIPTLQMVMKWLREKYNLEIYPYHSNLNEKHNSKWWFEIIKYPNTVAEYECGIDEEVDTYEEACEAAIKYCLENLI